MKNMLNKCKNFFQLLVSIIQKNEFCPKLLKPSRRLRFQWEQNWKAINGSIKISIHVDIFEAWIKLSKQLSGTIQFIGLTVCFCSNFEKQELNIFLGRELCGNQIKIATCGLIEPNLLFHTKWNMN